MSHSKKIRTKSTDGLHPRHIRRDRQIRLEIAAEAARIIATEGQHNYHAAKKKAAERIGVNERLALPSNTEVMDALGHYQKLYGGAAHINNLEDLRQVAVQAMQSLEEFSPRLVGSVLDGTADEYSRVALHIFSDSTESVIISFLEKSIPFSQEQRQIRWHDGSHRTMQLLVFEREGTAIELTLFEPIDLRQAPPSPIDGKPQRRATLAEAECLLAESTFAEAGMGAQNPPG